ncbi:MAG: response regulator [Candidatus Bathyarchaeia archaeon]
MREQLFDETFERRDKVQVLADILKVARDESKTTTILRLANLQYNKFSECRDILCRSGLLEEIDLAGDEDNMRTRYLYRTTERGANWSEKVERIYTNLGFESHPEVYELNHSHLGGEGETTIKEDPSEEPSPDTGELESPDVLVVDDEPDVRHLVKSYLENRDYRVATARNGAEAIEHAVKKHPDLVLLDIIMPGRTGFDVCRDLKLKKSTRDIPIVVYSVLDRPEDKEMAREAGADAFINKSLKPEQILETIKPYLPGTRISTSPINTVED